MKKNDEVSITIRWPSRLSRMVDGVANRLKSSKQSVITYCVLNRLMTHSMECWYYIPKEYPEQRVMQGVAKKKAVQEILDKYNYVPQDLQEAIKIAAFDLMIKRGLKNA